MKILQLCHKPPLPAIDGGCIAMNNVTTGLMSAGHKVKILTIFTRKHPFNPSAMPADYLDKTEIEGVFVDTRINMIDAFSNFMTSDSYNISRFFSPDYDIALTRLLKKRKFDIIHLESLFMTPYISTIKRYSNASIVLRSHNLEFVIWEKIASGTRNIAKRAYLKYLSNQLKNYELDILKSVNGIAAISEEDKNRFEALGVKKIIRNIPFGIRVDDYPEEDSLPEVPSLFHLGSMNWSPNLEGILWFIEDIWPEIHRRFPELKLYLAGRGMPENIIGNKFPNVIVIGEVEDAKAFMRSKSTMIVPLLSASGIRVKIIEGLALGKSVISTTIGAQGIDCIPGKNILIANDVESWVEAVDLLVSSPKVAEELGKEGRIHAKQHFDLTTITAKLISFYKELRKA
ncbi:MAG: glycosyltransferase family 4 protein [Crocinitomicaceae bacterium]|nr:glycosyltransferase family 4 protein [Crocinitomicaceae bacterium]